ncbi:hypothetical protein H8D57_01710 [bacterium]|nr:hypothetical protein [bacterium]
MAVIRNNVLLKGLSGKLGDQLVCQINGILRTRPDPSKLQWTDSQRQHRSLFREAKQFARAIEADPELKPMYKAKAKRGIGAYQVAISAYMHHPEIRKNPALISITQLK